MAELSLNREEKEMGGVLRLGADTTFSHEVSEEFSLPDYVPEIRRLLNVRAQVLPESKFLGDGAGGGTDLELGGTVTYLLLYTDDEGKLCSLPLSSTYEARTALQAQPSSVFIDTAVDSVTPRVNGPRKISLKSRLKSRVMGWEEISLGERVEGKSAADELFLERKTENVRSVSIKEISQQNIRISDKLDMQGTSAHPIWCDATATVSEARAQSNTVSVRGDVVVKCVCEENGEYVTLYKTMPLAEELDAQGAVAGDMARVSASCISLSVSNEQAEGEDKLFFDLVCEIEGELIRNGDVELTRDLYSTKLEADTEYKTVELYSAALAQCASFSINESIKRKEKEMEELIDIIGDPVYEKADFKNGKAIYSIKLNLTAVGRDKDGEYISQSYEVPLKYTCDLGKVSGEIIPRCTVNMGMLKSRLDGDKLLVNGEIYLAMSLMEKTKMCVLASAVLRHDKEVKREPAAVRIYFPKDGDTLWEIAKKYHTTVSALKEQNDLSADTVDGIKSLII